MVAGRYRIVPVVGRRWLLGLTALALSSLVAGTGRPEDPRTQGQAGGETDFNAPFAVVELFTSEFCGACPAADAMLSEIGAEARKTGQRIMPLAYHVDYFDRGAAVDPFGSPAFSKRQRNYAAVLNTDDVYTPQILVNGRSPFVGSERTTAVQQIRAALKRPATTAVRLTLQDAGRPSDLLTVNCEVQGATSSANLQIAVVERHPPVRGRTGRTAHPFDNVVRVFKTVPLNKGSYHTVELTIPRNLNRRNASVVAFVQDTKTWAIRGAASIDAAPGPAIEKVADAGR